ncbi:MAG TPA: alpha-glucan family phosphorylase [bacterium]|nr:alpha-glucan family phosphorylase [bacterium]
MSCTLYSLEVQPVIPAELQCLHEFANNLAYSWSRKIRGLFFRMDAELWAACGHNPKVFLRRVSQERVDEALADPSYMYDLEEARAQVRRYLADPIHEQLAPKLDPEKDLIAYFCAEYGFHESFPIYSGGLGILAGDHCKAASDLGLPFIAVGLLYRVGYFNQTFDKDGHQIETSPPVDFADLPVEPARNPHGEEVCFSLEYPGRKVQVKVWLAKVGRVRLFLLDTDVEGNTAEDRKITYQLYGGGREMRIQQEILLGIGGVRALRALNLHPNVWHMNEGHASFIVLERCREWVGQGMSFQEALECTAANAVFTTHTPVPAGHDVFDVGLVEYYLADMRKSLGLDYGEFMGLGDLAATPANFNMTTLALRGSRLHNGVSKIHGEVAARMEQAHWPEIDPEENPMAHVTNGVHVGTWLARDWANFFDQLQRDWHEHLCDRNFWEHMVEQIPDLRYWSVHQSLKREMFDDVIARITKQYRRTGRSQTTLHKALSMISQSEQDMLVVGFARRFATYKRALLVFNDLDALEKLVNDPLRPVVFIFAGKAHPADEPGQELIRRIWEISQRPEFLGKILLVEGYDMELARKLVTGVDVWLNTPEYPLEASGTSGQKAGLNGALNLSVLDGWWGEGFEGDNGWGIVPHGSQYSAEYRNAQESRDLIETLSNEVIPLYFARDRGSYSSGWVQRSKASMASILPRFNSERQVLDYTHEFYIKALHSGRKLDADKGALASALADWKARVRAQWHNVKAERLDVPPVNLTSGQSLEICVAVDIDGLSPTDVRVECQFGVLDAEGQFVLRAHYLCEATERDDKGRQLYVLKLEPSMAGLQTYRLRLAPWHPALTHPYEMGFMRWL